LRNVAGSLDDELPTALAERRVITRTELGSMFPVHGENARIANACAARRVVDRDVDVVVARARQYARADHDAE
jgi:hypothetical protein